MCSASLVLLYTHVARETPRSQDDLQKHATYCQEQFNSVSHSLPSHVYNADVAVTRSGNHSPECVHMIGPGKRIQSTRIFKHIIHSRCERHNGPEVVNFKRGCLATSSRLWPLAQRVVLSILMEGGNRAVKPFTC